MNPIPFTGEQFQQVQTALLDAFDRSSLEQLTRLEMDTNLNHVAGGQNETELVHNLIVWSIKQGQLVELIEAAARQNPGSELMRQLVADAQTWDMSAVDAKQFERVGSSPETVIQGVQYNVADITNSEAVAIGRGAIANSVKNFFFGEREEFIHQRNRQTMLQLVKSTWIEGVLEKSLHNEVLIDLNLKPQPTAVEYPWDMVIRRDDQNDEPYPPGTKIVDVFDQMHQSLLILGEPGSGKTTMLLELARQLIDRAEQDPTLPIPVVFNLSSWAEKRPSLAEWLVEEFRTKYRIPEKVSQRWLDNDDLFLLLDGLDEVQQKYREACVETVNAFRQKHLVPMALCSRTTEYESLIAQAIIHEAVLIQPLTTAQIDKYLDTFGEEELSIAREMLDRNTELQEQAISPLMLSIIILACSGMSAARASTVDPVPLSLQHLFDTYICRMFSRRNGMRSYEPAHCLLWLSWIAKVILSRGGIVFFADRIYPGYFTVRDMSHMWRYRNIVFLMVGLVGIAIAAIGSQMCGLIGGIILGLSFRASDVGLYWKPEYKFPKNVDLKVYIVSVPIGLLGGIFLSGSSSILFVVCIGIILGFAQAILGMEIGGSLIVGFIGGLLTTKVSLLAGWYAGALLGLFVALLIFITLIHYRTESLF